MDKTIKINFILVFIIMGCTPLLSAQAIFQKGKSYISAGYGFQLGSIGKQIKTDDNLLYSALGPIYLKYEYAITKKIGIGISAAYSESSLSWNETISYGSSTPQIFRCKMVYSKFTMLPRLNFHFGKLEKFDPYLGLGLGYRRGKLKFTSENPDFNSDLYTSSILMAIVEFPVSIEATIGVRYMATAKFGFFMEAGIGHGVCQGGLYTKF